ncbi:MAG TPA: crossover junction endodeoxyribonuclease RuvC [Methylomirabilota bacterium]|jgi:crossover junction endodeoxyribonuclease RuvC
MGVDPGLVATGFGVLEAGGGGVAVRDAGVISTTAGQPLEARLNALHRAIHRIIEAQGPELLVVEDLYTEYKFPRTAVLMGHARGVIYLAARQLGVAVVALSPAEVKRAMTGNGAAGKAQMQRAVQTVLGLKDLPRPSHVADALGLAASGMSRIAGRWPGGGVGLVGAAGGGGAAGSFSSSAGAQTWPPHSPNGGQPAPPHSPNGGRPAPGGQPGAISRRRGRA